MPTLARMIVVCLCVLGCADSKTLDDRDADGGSGTGGVGTAATGGMSGAGGMGGTGGTGGTGGMGGTGGSAGGSGFGPDNTVSLCGGEVCADDEACCLITARCFNRLAPGNECLIPSNTPADPYGAALCGTNSDCADGEFCDVSVRGSCGGVGRCAPRASCSTCSGGPCNVCGCDGVTYPSHCAAHAAGVRVAFQRGGCGQPQTMGGAGSGGAVVTITYCGSSDQCPAGQDCCARTGECFDPAKPALCDPPPTGFTRGCYTDADCYEGFCLGFGCDGPGGCGSVDGPCSRVFAPVCGCDGQSYSNAECATQEGIRIQHEGQCEEP